MHLGPWSGRRRTLTLLRAERSARISGRGGCCCDFRLKDRTRAPYIIGMALGDLAPETLGAERVATWLKAGGLRPTRQRLALAALLVGDGENRHVTAESLFAASSVTGKKVSLATVYNTLRAFCDAGLLNEVVVDGSKSYFDTRTDDHPHFYWEDSHTLTDAPADELQIAGLPKAPAGMEVLRVDVVIRLRRASPPPR